MIRDPQGHLVSRYDPEMVLARELRDLIAAAPPAPVHRYEGPSTDPEIAAWLTWAAQCSEASVRVLADYLRR